MIETARDGRSAALLIHGEAGVGKTSLLRTAGEHATGLRVLRARGIESESHLPFAALSELLAPLLDLRAEIPPVQAQALGGALALEAATVSDRFAVAAGVLSLLAAGPPGPPPSGPPPRPPQRPPGPSQGVGLFGGPPRPG